MRKTSEELQAIKKKHGVSRLWSWSRINCYSTSPYEYFLRYILHKEEDRANSVYAPAGGLAHDILQRFYEGKTPYEKMIDEFEDGWLVLELADLKFDRSSEERNAIIKEKYVFGLKHFFRHHVPLKCKTAVEKFLLIKIGKNVFQGYTDCVFKDSDEVYNIIDFKTSSIYKGSKLENEKWQLVLYALGLSQMGVPLEKIKIGWNFLKYCNVAITQANGKTTTRQIERCKIGESLRANCMMWLKKLGFENEVDEYIDLLIQTNDVDGLPEEVRDKYAFDDCYVYIELNDDVINELRVKIIDLISEINQKEKLYDKELDESIFMDDECNVEKDSYYFSNLCGYSPKLHKPWGKYIDAFNNKNRPVALGSDANESSESDNSDNLSWLDEI